MSSPSDNADYVAGFLKENDPDLYFSTLLLPGPERPHVQSIYAFGADVARIRQKVSQPPAGEIRLQYWVDLLNGNAHGQTRGNPLASGLTRAMERFDLPSGPFLRLLGARRFDLYDDPMPDLATFEGYAGETCSILFQMASIVLDGGRDAGTADAAGHLGVALCLVRHLRRLPFDSSRGQIFLPLSLFRENGCRETDLFSGRTTPQIVQTCASLRSLAQAHLEKAGKAIAPLPARVRPVFAPLALLKAQLSLLEKSSDRPFAPDADLANWQKIATLFLWAVRN